MAFKTKIENLEDLIKESIGGELVEQTVTSLLPPGENFGSVMYKIDFKVKKDGKINQYHAVGKCTPPNESTQKMFNIQETFKSEIGWYTSVIPTIKKFRKELGVEKEIDFFQPFYGARISLDPSSDKVDLGGILLTPNLKYLGYYNIDRHAGFDLPMTQKIISDLATYHAVFLALKLKNPKLFDAKVTPYLSTLGDTEKVNAFRNRLSFKIFKAIPEIQSIMDRIEKGVYGGKSFVGRPLREPWVTVIHMDVWMNNIMVIEGKNPKTMLLDLAFPNLGSPAADVMFFLITSVNFALVKEKFDEFLELYYNKFIENLEEMKVPTEKYTLKGWLEEVEEETRVGEFAHCLGHLVGILGDKHQDKPKRDSSEEPQIFDHDKFEDEFTPNERHKEKYKWLALEAIKRRWI